MQYVVLYFKVRLGFIRIDIINNVSPEPTTLNLCSGIVLVDICFVYRSVIPGKCRFVPPSHFNLLGEVKTAFKVRPRQQRVGRGGGSSVRLQLRPVFVINQI